MAIDLTSARVNTRSMAQDSIADSLGRNHPEERRLSFKQMQDCLDPRSWTKEMSDAWEAEALNVLDRPTLCKGFEALREAALKE